MDENISNNNELRNVSESDIGSLPKDSEGFGNIPKDVTETFRTFPNVSERTEYHTLSVRDTAKIFESARIPVTERTIINWCNANKRGIKRLDCFFDQHDLKYFITTHSVDKVIKEEVEKNSDADSSYQNLSERFGKNQKELPKDSEGFGNIPKDVTETFRTFPNVSERTEHIESQSQKREFGEAKEKRETEINLEDTKRIKELEQEIFDLKITNKGKDYFIEQLKQDREAVVQERVQLIDRLTENVKRIGVLEEKLMQLEAPKGRIIDAEENKL